MLNNNNAQNADNNNKQAFFSKVWKEIENKLFSFQTLNKEDKDFLNSLSPGLEQKLSDYCVEYGKPTAFYRLKCEYLEEIVSSSNNPGSLFKDDRLLKIKLELEETKIKYNELLASNNEVLNLNSNLLLENNQLIDELTIAEEKNTQLEKDNGKLTEALDRNNSLYERLEGKLDELVGENKNLRIVNRKLLLAKTQKQKGVAIGKSQSYVSNQMRIEHEPDDRLRIALLSAKVKGYLAPFEGKFENDFVSIYEGNIFAPLTNKTKIINKLLNEHSNAETTFRLICKKYNLNGTQTTSALKYFKDLSFKAK